MGEYHEDFGSWEDVKGQFEPDWNGNSTGLSWGSSISSRHQKVPATEPEDVLYAEYDNGGYDGSAIVIYRQGDKVFEVSGVHCSCYGLEDQWTPEEFDIPTYLAFVEKTQSSWDEMTNRARAVAAAKLRLLING